ncbi:MAG: Ig-like domain-containing protein, partial [Candidatus Latescibacterota bacterium]
MAQSVSTGEDAAFAITLSGSDPEGDPLAFAVANNPSNGTVSLTGAAVTYTPNANYNGMDSFSFTVSDAQLTSAPATVSITVAPANDVPTLAAPADTTMLEEGQLTGLPFTVDEGGGLDEDAQTLTVTASSSNAALFPTDSLRVHYVADGGADATGGTLDLAPAANANGTATITLMVSDGQAEHSTTTASFTVVVSPVNDAPTLAEIPGQTVAEDAGPQSLTLTYGPGGGSDETGQAVSVTATSSDPAVLPHPTVSGSILTYAPADNASGSVTITVTANDGQAANSTTVRTFTVTVTAANDAQTPPALTWGSWMNVSNSPGRYSTFSEVAATGDTVHVIWREMDPESAYYKRSLDGGVTWQGPYVFTTALVVVTKIVASGSKVVAFWVDQASGQYIVRSACSADAGATWSSAQDVSPSLGTHPGVAADMDSARVVVLWMEVSGTTVSPRMRISTDDGQSWGPTLNVPPFSFDPNEGRSTDVALAGSAIVVAQIETLWAVRTVRSTDGGQNWSSPVLVDLDASHVMHDVHLAADGSSVVMRWSRFFGAYNDEAMAAASADGGVTWSIPTSLSSGIGGSNSSGDISISGTRAVAVWGNNPAPDANDTPPYFRRSLDGGQTWEPASVIPNGFNRFGVPRCATTPNSVYVVGYTGSGSWDLYLVRGQMPSQGPTAITQSVSTDEDAAVATTLSGADPEGDPLTFAVASNPSNGTVGLTGATVTYTPNADYNGTDSFSFTVSDGQLSSVPATVSITVAPVNDVPTLAAPPDATMLEDGQLTGLPFTVDEGGGLDEDAQTLTVTASSSNPALFPTDSLRVHYVADGGADATGGTLDLAPAANANGTATITLVVSDGQAENSTTTMSFSVTVVPVVDEPIVGSVPDQTISEDAGPQSITLTYSPGGGPDEAGQTVTLAATSSNPALVPDPSVSGTTLAYTPAPDANGTATITVTATVGTSGGTAARSFSVTVIPVNDPPTLAEVAARTISEDAGPQTLTLSFGPGGGSDEAGQVVTLTAASSDPTLVPTPSVSGGALTFTLAPNATGTATVTVTASDGQSTNSTTTRTFAVTVTPVNDAPALTAPGDTIIAEDGRLAGLSFTVDEGGGLDEDAQGLTVTASSSNPSLLPPDSLRVLYTADGTADATGGTLDVAPTANASGTATITLTVSDSQSANGTAAQSFTVLVSAVNDAPTLSAPSDQAIPEDAGPQTVTLTVGSGGGSDESGQTVTVTATSSNPALILHPTVSGSALAFTPAPDANGTATVTVTANDGQAVNSTTTRTFTITVTPVNDPPALTAPRDTTIAEDGRLVGLAFAVDEGDGSDEDVQSLTVTATSSNPLLVPADSLRVRYTPDGTADATGGTLDLAPAANASGTTTITVTASDGQAANSTTPRSFTVTVTPVNDPPRVAANHGLTLRERATALITQAQLQASDADHPAAQLTYTVQTAPGRGTLTRSGTALLANSRFTQADVDNDLIAYVHAAGDTLPDRFTFTVADAAGATTATTPFAITVTSVVRPIANAATVAVREDSLLDIALAGSDPAGQPLTFQVVGQPGHADTLRLTASTATSATARYRPAADYNGTDRFTFTVSNGLFTSSPATVAVTVTPVNDAPRFTPGGDRTVLEDAGPQVFDGWATALSAGPPDEAGQQLTFAVSTPDTGLFAVRPAIDATGRLSCTPAPDAHGRATVWVRLRDSGGTASGGVDTSAASPFTITVSPVNDPPALTAARDTTITEDGRLVGLAFTVDEGGGSDEDVQSLTVTATSSNPSLVPADSLRVRYTPDGSADATGGTLDLAPAANASGTSTITVTASDGQAANSTTPRNFTVTVAAVNDNPVLAALPDTSIAEGQRLTFPLGATDVDGDTLAFSASGLPLGASVLGSVFSWTPTYTQAQADPYRPVFTVRDGKGGVHTVSPTITVRDTIPPPLRPVPLGWEVGDIAEGTVATRTFALHNPGTVAVRLDSLVTRTAAFAATAPATPLTLGAGDSLAVTIRFAPLPRQRDAQRDTLTVYSTAGVVRVPLSGRGLWVGFAVQPRTLDFGPVPVGGSLTLPLRVQNPGNVRLEVSSAEVSVPFAPAPRAFNVLPGAQQEVLVTYAPVLPGRHEGTLTLGSNADSVHVVRLRGGAAPPRPGAPPPSLDFGPVPVDSAALQAVVLRSAGSDTLRVTALGGLARPFSAAPAGLPPLAPGDSATVVVRFAPTQAGAASDTLGLDSNGGRVEVVVGGRGAVEAHLDVPDTLAFGEVRVGERAETALVVRNAGTDTLRMDDIQATNRRFAVTPTGLRVPPRGAASLTVTFAPDGEGPQVGRLLFVANAPGREAVLTGTGIASTVALRLQPP